MLGRGQQLAAIVSQRLRKKSEKVEEKLQKTLDQARAQGAKTANQIRPEAKAENQKSIRSQ